MSTIKEFSRDPGHMSTDAEMDEVLRLEADVLVGRLLPRLARLVALSDDEDVKRDFPLLLIALRRRYRMEEAQFSEDQSREARASIARAAREVRTRDLHVAIRDRAQAIWDRAPARSRNDVAVEIHDDYGFWEEQDARTLAVSSIADILKGSKKA